MSYISKSSNTLRIECGHLWKYISKYWYFHEMVWWNTQMWSSSKKTWTIYFLNIHSVESRNMVDPQWNIWFLKVQVKFAHSLLKCGWLWVGHHLCLLWDCFIPSRLPVFDVEPQYLLQYFLFFCQKYHLNYTYKIFKKFHVGLKFEWVF